MHLLMLLVYNIEYRVKGKDRQHNIIQKEQFMLRHVFPKMLHDKYNYNIEYKDDRLKTFQSTAYSILKSSGLSKTPKTNNCEKQIQ